MINKFICSGRTGDLIHNLLVIKSLYEQSDKKGILYITNDKKYGGDSFLFDINKTYDDLSPVVSYQDYIESFHILQDNQKIEESINLNSWRRAKLFMKSSWIDILCDHHCLRPPINPWIKYEKLYGLEETVLIHRSTKRHSSNFPWEKIVNENKCKFVTNSIAEYEYFPYKNKVELLLCDTFSELVKYINSCKFFVGNMSTPLALAHSLGIPHLGEMFYPDDIHYIGDKKYLNNFYYIKQDGFKEIEGINRYINL